MRQRVSISAPRDRGAARKVFRDLEHRLDIACRLRKHEVDHGLVWFEVDRNLLTRLDCLGCGRVACRRWVGVWYEYELAPGRTPYAIVQTVPLCASCAVKRQAAEERIPIWRPIGWRRRT